MNVGHTLGGCGYCSRVDVLMETQTVTKPSPAPHLVPKAQPNGPLTPAIYYGTAIAILFYRDNKNRKCNCKFGCTTHS